LGADCADQTNLRQRCLHAACHRRLAVSFYVSGKLIPDLTIRSMILLGVLGIAMVYLFMPKGSLRLNNRMFFLGAAFMLLETRAGKYWSLSTRS
jgi:hypothetical protein